MFQLKFNLFKFRNGCVIIEKLIWIKGKTIQNDKIGTKS